MSVVRRLDWVLLSTTTRRLDDLSPGTVVAQRTTTLTNVVSSAGREFESHLHHEKRHAERIPRAKNLIKH